MDRIVGASEASAPAVFRGGAQQAAVGLFRLARAGAGVPERAGLAAEPDRRIRLRSAVSVRSDSTSGCRAASGRIFICSFATTSTSWIARRSRSSAINTTSHRASLTTAGACRDSPSSCRRHSRDMQAGEIVSDHTPEEYMAKVETCAGRHEAGRLLRGRSAADLLSAVSPAASPRCSSASSRPARVHTSS